MKELWENRLLARILALVLLTALLGLSPQPHQVARALIQAARARSSNAHLPVAKNLAIVATHLPWRTNLWEPAGREALAGGDPIAAIEYFKQAAATGSLSQDGYIQFGDAYQASGNPYTAIQLWETANLIFGPLPAVLERIAAQQRESKDYPALITTLKAIAQIEGPFLTDINYELGLLLAAVDPVAAPPYLLQAVERNPQLTAAREMAFAIQRALPNDNPAYTRMVAGRKLGSFGHWDLAAYAFQTVTQTNPDYSEGWAYLGEARQHLPDLEPEDILIPLQKAIELDPTSLPANTFMAVYWQRNGSPELSQQYLTAAVQLDPSNPDLLVDLGAATAILGDLETAVAYYNAAVDVTAANPVYLRALGEFCIRYNHNLEGIALPAARQALLADAHDPGSLDLMGQVLFRMGDLLNAQRFLLRAITIDPDFAPAHLHLGLVQRLQGESSLAAQSFRMVISLAPDTPTADLAVRFLDELAAP